MKIGSILAVILSLILLKWLTDVFISAEFSKPLTYATATAIAVFSGIGFLRTIEILVGLGRNSRDHPE